MGTGEGLGRDCQRRFCFLEHSYSEELSSNDLEIRQNIVYVVYLDKLLDCGADSL